MLNKVVLSENLTKCLIQNYEKINLSNARGNFNTYPEIATEVLKQAEPVFGSELKVVKSRYSENAIVEEVAFGILRKHVISKHVGSR